MSRRSFSSNFTVWGVKIWRARRPGNEMLTTRCMVWVWGGGGLVANFVWEVSQRPLYANYRFSWREVLHCFLAALGDVLILAVLYTVMRLIFGSWLWPQIPGAHRIVALVGLGAVIASAIERHALSVGRWTYSENMPLFPGTSLGLIPVLQMALIPLLLTSLSRRCPPEKDDPPQP